jgi:hypothetical protein
MKRGELLRKLAAIYTYTNPGYEQKAIAAGNRIRPVQKFTSPRQVKQPVSRPVAATPKKPKQSLTTTPRTQFYRGGTGAYVPNPYVKTGACRLGNRVNSFIDSYLCKAAAGEAAPTRAANAFEKRAVITYDPGEIARPAFAVDHGEDISPGGAILGAMGSGGATGFANLPGFVAGVGAILPGATIGLGQGIRDWWSGNSDGFWKSVGSGIWNGGKKGYNLAEGFVDNHIGYKDWDLAHGKNAMKQEKMWTEDKVMDQGGMDPDNLSGREKFLMWDLGFLNSATQLAAESIGWRVPSSALKWGAKGIGYGIKGLGALNTATRGMQIASNATRAAGAANTAATAAGAAGTVVRQPGFIARQWGAVKPYLSSALNTVKPYAEGTLQAGLGAGTLYAGISQGNEAMDYRGINAD